MSSREQRKKKHPFRKILAPMLILGLGVSIVYVVAPSQSKPASEPVKQEPLGRVVIIELPNGHVMTTHEKYIVRQGDKLYYKGDRNTVDISDGEVTYQ